MRTDAVEVGTEPHLKKIRLGSCFPEHIKVDIIGPRDLDVK